MTQEEGLKQAIALIKTGKKGEAVPILKDILKTNRNDETAWLWLSVCIDKPEDKKFCFQEALRINPNNEQVKKALEQLEPNPTPQPSIEELSFVQAPPPPAQPIQVQYGEAQPKKKISPLLYILVTILIFGGIYLCLATSSNSNSTVTMAKFTQIQPGMSYQQVVNIMGEQGEVMSRVDLVGITDIMYGWKNSDGSNMNAMFQNDQLVSKAQFGLK